MIIQKDPVKQVEVTQKSNYFKFENFPRFYLEHFCSNFLQTYEKFRFCFVGEYFEVQT